MALKAGRVGVAPDQVDDFGKVKSSDILQESAVTDIVNGASVGSDYGNHLIKKGNVVQLVVKLTGVTAQQFSTVICKVPEGFRPKYKTAFRDAASSKWLYCSDAGSIICASASISNTDLVISATWITG